MDTGETTQSSVNPEPSATPANVAGSVPAPREPVKIQASATREDLEELVELLREVDTLASVHGVTSLAQRARKWAAAIEKVLE